MNKKLLTLVGICIMTSMTFIGCTNGQSKSDVINTEISKLKETNKKLEDRVTVLEGQVFELQNEKKHTNEDELGANQNKEDKMYNIYTANIDTYEKEVEMTTYIPESLTLEEKLNMLTKTLSEVSFGNLPIEVMSIDNIDGKRIATINLKESKENEGVTDPADFKGDTWSGRYFQGSAGGSITATTLTETLLQRDYEGEWIDGVKFLYKGAPIEFEHVGNLSEITYR